MEALLVKDDRSLAKQSPDFSLDYRMEMLITIIHQQNRITVFKLFYQRTIANN